MSEVLIRGSRNPCVELGAGEERRVQFDDHVQRLIDRGYVEVVEWHDKPAPPREEPAPEAEPEPEQPHELQIEVTDTTTPTSGV